MFSATTLQRKLRPHGIQPQITEIPPKESPGTVEGLPVTNTDRKWYRAIFRTWTINKVLAECQLDFSLPIPDRFGVFNINGMSRYIVREGIVDLHRYQVGKPLQFIFRDNTTILLRTLNEIFHGNMTDFFFTGKHPSVDDLQAAIDSWFFTSPLSHTVDSTSTLHLSSLQEMVYMRLPSDSLDLSMRYFQDSMWGILDPSSTPQGEKVNLSYRLCKGTQIIGGLPVRSQNMFCTTTQEYGIAGSLTPRRMHLMRTSFEHTLSLVRYENPLVGNPGLPGRHLITAVMNYRGYTGEDAIVFSEDAAQKMMGIRMCYETLHVTGDVHLHVQEGDHILPGARLAEAVDITTGTVQEFYTQRLTYPSEIMSVQTLHTTVAGMSTLKIRIGCRAEVPIETGDKVFTRAGMKGVAFVLPNERMPVLPNGRRVDVCISPESVVNRVAMSFYWEMMANDHVFETGETVLGSHENPSPSFEEFVAMGRGEKQQLTLKGEPLEAKTFCGRVFFLRIDKLARESVSSHDGKVVFNGHRLAVNTARTNGQRRGLAAGMTMLARDLRANFFYLLRDNMHGKYACNELIHALTPEE